MYVCIYKPSIYYSSGAKLSYFSSTTYCFFLILHIQPPHPTPPAHARDGGCLGRLLQLFHHSQNMNMSIIR